MKVKYSITFNLDDNLTETELEQEIESKRKYLEDDVRVRFHNPNLVVKAKTSQKIQRV